MPPAYLGPKSHFEDMLSGCSIEDLGLQVMVGPSKICDGLGLFVALGEDVESALLLRGTPVCGYSKGTMVPLATGTFTVAYVYVGMQNGVIFQKRLMPLVEAVGLAADMTNTQDLRNLVAGHELLWDADDEEIIIKPTDDYDCRYFIPDDPLSVKATTTASTTTTEATGEGAVWTVGNMGMYANDCAYSPSATEQSYRATSPAKNVLQIVWRLDLNEQGQLAPTWPVVVLLRDALFTNVEPMEVGLQYSWRYWDAQRILDAEEAEEGGKALGGEEADEGPRDS